MGEDVETLNIKISADTSGTESKIDSVSKSLKKLSDAFGKTSGAAKSWDQDLSYYGKVYDRMEALAKKLPKIFKGMRMNDIMGEVRKYGESYVNEWAHAVSSGDSKFKDVALEDFEEVQSGVNDMMANVEDAVSRAMDRIKSKTHGSVSAYMEQVESLSLEGGEDAGEYPKFREDAGYLKHMKDLAKATEEYSDAYARAIDLAKEYPKAFKGFSQKEMTEAVKRYGGEFLREWAYDTTTKKNLKGMDFEQYEQFRDQEASLSGRFKRFIENLKNATNHTNRFGSALKRILMYRAIRAVLNEISKALSEGIGNLYQYSKAFGGDFANAMDRASTSLLYLRNSIAASLGPVIEMLVPYLERLVDWVVEGVNWLNQLFATIRGSETWTKAVKVNKEYADASKEVTEATEEEAEAVKSLISGFDELNILEDKAAKNASKSAITGANPSPLTMFEEVNMDVASESAKKWGERIRGIIEGVKKIMDDLGITFEDILKTAGLIGAALLGWKLATGLIDGIKTLIAAWDVLRVPIGIALVIAGAGISLDGAFDLAKEGITPQNILETIIGNGLIVGGMYLALGGFIGGVPALLLGVGLAIVIDTIGFALGQEAKAKENYSELFSELEETHERLQKKIDESLEFKGKVKIHFEEVQTELSEIESRAEAARRLVEKLFDLEGKENKTAEELEVIRSIADQLSRLGIEIHIDEEGHVKETREQIDGLIEDMKRAARTSALMQGLTQAYRDQYDAQKLLKDAQVEVKDASEKFYEVQELLWKSLNEEEKAALGAKKETDLYGDVLDNAYVVADKLDWETWVLIDALKAAGENWDDSKKLADNYSEALEEVKKNVQYYEDELDIANGKELITGTDNTQLNDTTERVKEYGKQIDLANLKVLFPKANEEQLNALLQKLTGDYPNAVNGANREQVTIKTDTSSVDDAMDKLRALKKKVDDNFEVDIRATVHTSSSGAEHSGSGGRFATGGFPEAGQMFIAREAGPELVGQIGRRTAVANNDQIVEGIAGGVRTANGDVVNALYAAASQIVRAVNEKDTSVILDGQRVSESVTRNQNRANRMYGTVQSNA